MRILKIWTFFTMIILLGCDTSDDAVDPVNGTDGLNSLFNVTAEPEGDQCANGGFKIDIGLDNNQNDVLDTDEITSSQFVCTGTDGTDGFSSLFNITEEAAGTNCTTGGFKIGIGIDNNNNGTLDEDEITNNQFVCNGNTEANGLNSLINVTTEPSGINCANGGLRVDIGTDKNRNDILDVGEITNTQYVCNGEFLKEQKDYYFQNGWKGYGGTTAVRINNNSPDKSFYTNLFCDLGTPRQDTSRVLLKFGDLNTIVSSDFEENSVYVNEAILYVYTTVVRFGQDGVLAVGTYDVSDSSVPSFNASTTWINATESIPWTFPGSYEIEQKPFNFDKYNGLTFGRYDDRIHFEGNNGFLRKWIPLRLSRNAVSQWLASGQNNKGLVLSVMEAFHQDGAAVGIYGPRDPIQELKPMLYLNVERAPSSGRVAHKSDDELAAEWNKKTMDEKLAPLMRFINSK